VVTESRPVPIVPTRLPLPVSIVVRHEGLTGNRWGAFDPLAEHAAFPAGRDSAHAVGQSVPACRSAPAVVGDLLPASDVSTKPESTPRGSDEKTVRRYRHSQLRRTQRVDCGHVAAEGSKGGSDERFFLSQS
jgi:hypothetical protein